MYSKVIKLSNINVTDFEKGIIIIWKVMPPAYIL